MRLYTVPSKNMAVFTGAGKHRILNAADTAKKAVMVRPHRLQKIRLFQLLWRNLHKSVIVPAQHTDI